MRKTIILLALLLCGCAAVNGGRTMKKTVPDVTETFSWLGKTAEELGLDETVFDGFAAEVTGDLFGKTVSGTAFFQTGADRIARVTEISLYGKLSDRAATERGLTERFGKAYAEGMDPYVASNGGATYWKRYWTGESVITVSNGQNNDWYMLSCRASELPKELAKAQEGLTTEELMYATGVKFRFSDGEVEDLRIFESEYEGKTAYRVTFGREGTYVCATIVRDGRELYEGCLNDGTEWTQRRLYGIVDSLRAVLPDGSGRIVQKIPTGDFWLIETDAPATLESLDALEIFLLTHWLVEK